MGRRVWWVLLVAAIATRVPRAAARPVSSEVLSWLPRTVGQVSYLDVHGLQQYAWFDPLREQMLPTRFRQFERFLQSVGIDVHGQLQELVWATVPATQQTPEEVVGVALGEFSPDTVRQQCLRLQLPAKTIRGDHWFAFGSGESPYDVFFSFPDPNHLVFGQKDALEQMAAARSGEAETVLSHPELAGLIQQANGQGPFWAVLGRFYAQQGLRQFMPALGQFGQASALLQKMQALVITVDVSSDIGAQFEAVLPTVDDANTFAALLQAGLLYQRYQPAAARQPLWELLDQAQIVPRGDRLDLRVRLRQEQLLDLIRQRAFAVPM